MHRKLMSRSIAGRLGRLWDWLNEGAHGEAFRITLLCTVFGTIGGAFTGIGALFGFALSLGICTVMFATIAALLGLAAFINSFL